MELTSKILKDIFTATNADREKIHGTNDQSLYAIVRAFSDSVFLCTTDENRPCLILSDSNSSRVIKTSGFLTKVLPYAKITLSSLTKESNCYIIESTDGLYLEPFFCMCSELISCTVNPDSILDVDQIVAEWIAYFQRLKSIDLQTEIGLWGELFLIINSQSPATFFENWTGPDGAAHDFDFGQHKLEAKTALRVRRHHLSNSQLNQLHCTNSYIASLLLIQDEGAGISTWKLVEQLAQSTGLEALLKKVPYSDFSGKKFRLQTDVQIYHQSQIPAIRLPEHFVSAKFEVDFDGFSPLNQQDLPETLAHFVRSKACS